MLRKLGFTILLALLIAPAYAQFKLSGQFRPRGEFRDGYGTLVNASDKSASFISQRTRLNVGYIDGKIESYMSFQDFRVWGDEELKKDNASLALHQGWLKYKFDEHMSLKLGRQSLAYDNARLISGVNWNQKSASHDALVFKYKRSGWTFDVVAAYNQESENKVGTNYDLKHYKFLNIIWLSRKYEKGSISWLSLSDGNEKDGTENTMYMRYTTGGSGNIKFGDLKLEARSFKQFGKTKAGTDISAWMYHVEAKYKLSSKFDLMAGYEVKSGDKSDDDKYNAFDILYGARHKFNGNIDYYSIPSTTANSGLNDLYLNVGIKLGEKAKLKIAYHNLATNTEFYDGTEKHDGNLGHEMDIILDYKIQKNFAIQTGFCQMWASDTAKHLPKFGTDKRASGSYAFLMLTYKPSFLN